MQLFFDSVYLMCNYKKSEEFSVILKNEFYEKNNACLWNKTRGD